MKPQMLFLLTTLIVTGSCNKSNTGDLSETEEDNPAQGKVVKTITTLNINNTFLQACTIRFFSKQKEAVSTQRDGLLLIVSSKDKTSKRYIVL